VKKSILGYSFLLNIAFLISVQVWLHGIPSLSYKERVEGVVIGAALGDALGRVTEFIDTTVEIKKKYSAGVKDFSSFSKEDYITINGKKTALYTDDTVMAKIVLEEALKGKKDSLTIDQITRNIAYRFTDLFGPNKYKIDPFYYHRAHGFTNMNMSSDLSDFIDSGADISEWFYLYRPGIEREGGCGSVMRAWPVGLVYSNDEAKLIELTDKQSQLSHRHPMARVASIAIAVGVAEVIQGKSPRDVVNAMVKVAERYDMQELAYKNNAEKIVNVTLFDPVLVAEDKLLTSDMIRYADYMANKGEKPEKVLGTHNVKGENSRSIAGFLLGWAADESIAAATYIFLRHPDNLQEALKEAVNTPGDSDSIATLVGALVGARAGLKNLPDISRLENIDGLKLLAHEACEITKK